MSDEKQDDYVAVLKPLVKDRKSRYVVWPNGYVLDRALFRWYILILGAVALVIFVPSFFNGTYLRAYASCPEDAIGGWCDNPLYGKCDLPACEAETLRAGESIGEPPKSNDGFLFVTFASLIILFLFNHFSQQGPRYTHVRNTYRQ